jgi:hypothetical protein
MTEPVHDIFISYAHIDNEPCRKGCAGWVSTFVDNLRREVSKKLGRRPIIWDDRGLEPNERVTDTLMTRIATSRTLVMFMSPSYWNSYWCGKELVTFLNQNAAIKNKESVFIVELQPVDRGGWHHRLQELTPVRMYDVKAGTDEALQFGYPMPDPESDRDYWAGVNQVAHLLAKHLKAPQTQETINAGNGPVIWLAEPTDDLIGNWRSLADALLQAGIEIKPVGPECYERGNNSAFERSVKADLANARILVQLLGPHAGRKPKEGEATFTSLQGTLARELAKTRQIPFLQWRSHDFTLESVADESYRELLKGAIACGFEEFRQRVLAAVQHLLQPMVSTPVNAGESLAICINANKADRDLGYRVRDMLMALGADALTAPVEPIPGQTPTEFNAQLDEVLTGSEGVIIVYGQTTPAWVQAQYVRARKALAQQRRGVWGALLDGPPREKPEHGVAASNLMLLECREGPQRSHIERFVNALRGTSHA